MVIPKFVNLLDNLYILPIDSESLTQAMHERGINMRYLSEIAARTQLAHVFELTTTEMLARTIKRLMNEQMSELICENKRGYSSLKY